MTFGCMNLKLWPNILLFSQFGSPIGFLKSLFLEKNLKLIFSLYMCVKSFESFYFGQSIKSYEEFLFANSYGFSTLK